MSDKFNLDGFSVDENDVCTAAGGFVGDVTGDITGGVSAGANNITATSGDITTSSGNIEATAGFISATGIDIKEVVYTSDGSIPSNSDVSFAILDASSASTIMTHTQPVTGKFLVVTCSSAINTCTLTLTSGDFNGAGGNVATFDAAEESLVLFGISSSRYLIIENIGGVVIS